MRYLIDQLETYLVQSGSVSIRLFTHALYFFLLLKILFVLPIATDMGSSYQYHPSSFLVKVLAAPGVWGRQEPFVFLALSAGMVAVLIFMKRTYFRNGFVFWLAFNVMQVCEPVANGSDYVLNLMLMLSIPFVSSSGTEEIKILIRNGATLLIQFHLALIYLLSGIDKLFTKSWRNGEALSYISQLDYFADPNSSLFQSPWAYGVAWLTIVFELAFPVLIWFKHFRIPLLIMGVIFHLGIIFLLNLPDFGLLMILCYIIFIPAKSKKE